MRLLLTVLLLAQTMPKPVERPPAEAAGSTEARKEPAPRQEPARKTPPRRPNFPRTVQF